MIAAGGAWRTGAGTACGAVGGGGADSEDGERAAGSSLATSRCARGPSLKGLGPRLSRLLRGRVSNAMIEDFADGDDVKVVEG